MTVFTARNASYAASAPSGTYTITGSNDTVTLSTGNYTLSDSTSSQNNIFNLGAGTDTLTFYGTADQISVGPGANDHITLRGANEVLNVGSDGANVIAIYGTNDSATVGTGLWSSPCRRMRGCKPRQCASCACHRRRGRTARWCC